MATKMVIRLLMFLTVCHCTLAQTLPAIEISLLSPQGVRMQLPDDPSISLVGYHYSVNKNVIGVAPGDYNVDVNAPTGGYWRHDNPDIVVNPGDVVNYWYLAIINGQGQQKTDQSWTAGSPTCPPCPQVADVKPTADPIFEDNFDSFDKNVWEHEITAGGGGNWEFQFYTNNRTNSYVRDGKLFIKPTLTEDTYGPGFVSSGTLNLWGASPANLCTGHAWWGCERLGTGTNYINPVQSARLRSVHSFSFTYGKVEVSAKMPTGDWLWPAIWLLPKHNGYGEWPASGEIDLVESRGNRYLTDGSGTSVGVDQIGTAMHWGPFFELNSYGLTHAANELIPEAYDGYGGPDNTMKSIQYLFIDLNEVEVAVARDCGYIIFPIIELERNLVGDDFGKDFHKYVLEWTPNEIRFLIDEEEIMKVDPGAGGFYDFGDFVNRAPNTNNPWQSSPNKMAPFDREFYIILNVAVGGTGGYWSDGLTNQPYPKPWLDTSPTAAKDFWLAKNSWYPTWNPTVNNGEDAAMQIDYIRVWADGSY